MHRFTRKVALVTNVSEATGRSAAQLLNRQGYLVFGAVNPRDSGGRIVDEGTHVAIDLSTPRSLEQSFRKMQDSVGRIDILLTVPPSSRDVSPQALPCIEKLRSEIEINVLKNASIVNTFLPLLKAAKQSCVVMISSAAASLGDRVIAKRSTDKATCVALTALNALAKTYAEQLEPYGIKVNVIAPDAGVMSTDVTAGESILEEVSRLILQTGTHILGSPTGCFLSVNGTVSW